MGPSSGRNVEYSSHGDGKGRRPGLSISQPALSVISLSVGFLGVVAAVVIAISSSYGRMSDRSVELAVTKGIDQAVTTAKNEILAEKKEEHAIMRQDWQRSDDELRQMILTQGSDIKSQVALLADEVHRLAILERAR